MHTLNKLMTISTIFAAAMMGACSEDGKPMAHATFHIDTALVTDAGTETGSIYTAQNGDQIRIDSLEVEIESIALVAAGSGSGGDVEFDPANPPAPFTNCHGDHCHSTESDATYTFEEIKQILADKASGKATVFEADIEKGVTFTALNQTQSLSNIASGDLDETTIAEYRVKLGEIHFKGHNITQNAAIDFKNEHEHEEEDHDHEHEGHNHEHEHAHIDMVSLSTALSRTINSKSDYEQEFHGVISIHAAFIEDIISPEGEIDFADVIADHATLKMAHE
ncbi:MAG: hypothetical protein J6A01_08015 [Proteobacteria bacterium]|nr:hypothetical protein [Pseudomonadota bacterium]